MKYKLLKPKLTDKHFKEAFELIIKGNKKVSRQEVSALVQSTLTPRYLCWDKIKYKQLPQGINAEVFWQMVKFTRGAQMQQSPIKTNQKEHFTWLKVPHLENFLHIVDLYAGGSLYVWQKDVDQKNKYRFISRGVMEEAIASSQLEGAHTTRKVAQQLLREKRRPRNKSEQMILNNYETMQFVEQELKHESLTEDMLLELHSMITHNTVPAEELGRFRKDEDDIVVGDDTGVIYHTPPKMAVVTRELRRFIKFANDELSEPFIHPVVKAIMLHFWIGYLHPFTDGNGRIARLLFYWYLLKHEYWAFTYLPISRAIKQSPSQYQKAYIYTEQDDLDLTYFIDYNIKKIQQSLDEFRTYVERQSQENLKMKQHAQKKYGLNDRQIQLLQYYHQNANARTNPTIHMNVYGVSKVTAINDLKKLVEVGLLHAKKSGRNVYYYATPKMKGLFEK